MVERLLRAHHEMTDGHEMHSCLRFSSFIPVCSLECSQQCLTPLFDASFFDPFPTVFCLSCMRSNADIVAGWRKRGKNKKEAKNFGYTTLLPDKIPQSINI